jgi:hypothetical protein
MGWRVRWYKANKEKPVILTKDDEGYDCITINGKEIMYDQGTDVWCDLSYNNDEFKKEIKCLCKDPDRDYFSITKEGFKMIILAYRDKVIDTLKKQIDVYKNPDLKNSPDYWGYDGNILCMVEDELRTWELYWLRDDGGIGYENINLHKSKDEFGISGSWKYKYGIFDMIEVYKYFDWDNYTMVVYGG